MRESEIAVGDNVFYIRNSDNRMVTGIVNRVLRRVEGQQDVFANRQLLEEDVAYELALSPSVRKFVGHPVTIGASRVQRIVNVF